MKEYVWHPAYGEIVYSESFWTGKKTLTLGGTAARSVSRKAFDHNGTKINVKGSYYTGISLQIGNDTVTVTPKPKWYEIVLAILPLFFLLTWGNSAFLCAIFPIVGGAIGGGLGALSGLTSLFFMIKSKSPLVKVLIGVGAFLITVLIAFLLALLLLSILI